jgi:hypothetical protein
MPNWCNNGVTVTHSDPAKIAALAEAMAAGKFLNHILPVPEALTNTLAGYPGPDKEAEHNAQMARNIELYGHKDWYDFCVARWGTKWDVDCSGTIEIADDGHTIHASFDSAWSPPIGIYEAMIDDGYEVQAYYYEPGMCFVGKWDNGYDECYELGGYDSKTVREAIGEELDDYWAISENMAEWEAENEE